MMQRIAQNIRYGSKKMVQSFYFENEEISLPQSSFTEIPAVEITGICISETFYEIFRSFRIHTHMHMIRHEAISKQPCVTLDRRQTQADDSMPVIFLTAEQNLIATGPAQM